MPSKPRRAGAASEVQILLGMSKLQNATIKRAAALFVSDDEREKPISRAEYIREAAHERALADLKKAGK